MKALLENRIAKTVLFALLSLLLFALCYFAVAHFVYGYAGLADPLAGAGECDIVPTGEMASHFLNTKDVWFNSHGAEVYGNGARFQFEVPEGRRFVAVDFDAGIRAYRLIRVAFKSQFSMREYVMTLRDGWNVLDLEADTGGVFTIIPCDATLESITGFSFKGFASSESFFLAKELWLRSALAFLSVSAVAAALILKRKQLADASFKHKRLWVFGLVFVVMCAAFFVFGIPKNYFDSAEYIYNADSLIQNGSFDFRNFPVSIRGYAYSLLLFVFRNALSIFGVSESVSMCLMMSAYAAFVFAFPIPALFEEWTKKKASAFSCLLPFALTLLFFRGLLLHTLTDFTSAVLLAALAWALCKIINGEGSPILKTAFFAFLCGALAYLTYNVRSINIFLFLVVPAGLVWTLRKRGARQLTAALLAGLLGFFVAAVPQVIINDNNFGKKEVLVSTDSSYEGGLLLHGLINGLPLTRYETYVGDQREDFLLNDTDALGGSLYRELMQEGEKPTTPECLSFMLSHPIEYFSIFARRALCAMDSRYPEIYIEELYAARWPLDILSWGFWLLLVLFGSTALFDKGSLNNKQGFSAFFSRSGLLLLVLLSSSVLTLPFHVEVRYYYPAWLTGFCYLAYCADFKALWNRVKANGLAYALLALASAAVLFAHWSYINAQMI